MSSRKEHDNQGDRTDNAGQKAQEGGTKTLGCIGETTESGVDCALATTTSGIEDGTSINGAVAAALGLLGFLGDTRVSIGTTERTTTPT